PESATPAKNCPQCGAPVTASAPEGLCPRCIAMANLFADTAMNGAAGGQAQPPSTPGEISAHFPQLEIIEFLGRGGMGVVYKARQKTLGRLVALKLVAPERAADPRFAARFEKEARALAALNHPNIVTVHDHGRAGDHCFLVMEYVDGVTLRGLLAGGRIST